MFSKLFKASEADAHSITLSVVIVFVLRLLCWVVLHVMLKLFTMKLGCLKVLVVVCVVVFVADDVVVIIVVDDVVVMFVVGGGAAAVTAVAVAVFCWLLFWGSNCFLTCVNIELL